MNFEIIGIEISLLVSFEGFVTSLTFWKIYVRTLNHFWVFCYLIIYERILYLGFILIGKSNPNNFRQKFDTLKNHHHFYPLSKKISPKFQQLSEYTSIEWQTCHWSKVQNTYLNFVERAAYSKSIFMSCAKEKKQMGKCVSTEKNGWVCVVLKKVYIYEFLYYCYITEMNL